jgi:uncharacterized membrane protein
MNLETTIAIDAPPTRVWDVISSIERWPEWDRHMGDLKPRRAHRRRAHDHPECRRKGDPRLRLSQSGPLAAIAALLAGRQTRRYVQLEAERLKHAAEADRPRLDRERDHDRYSPR